MRIKKYTELMRMIIMSNLLGTILFFFMEIDLIFHF